MLVNDVLVGCYGKTHHVFSSPQLLIHNLDISGMFSMLLFWVPYKLQMYKFHVLEHPLNGTKKIQHMEPF
jgi:hypothetical protein